VAAVNRIYDLYGSRNLDASALCAEISTRSGLRFVLHSSSYVGDYYRAEDVDAGLVWTIRPNMLDDEDGPFLYLPDYPEVQVLVQIGAERGGDSLTALDNIRAAVEQIVGVSFLGRKS